ncbi:MAG: biotin transporter BioY [Oscillospiraceae bacterium]|nr:biotin transporter BioY [Oscillospiraceae bacterium]
MVIPALMAALLCVLGPITVPAGPIPLSLATLGICLAGLLLGWKRGTVSVLVYLAIGLVGLPVFSGFSGGVGKLLGPTGGYLLGYVPLVFITGLTEKQKKPIQLLAMTAGTVVLYLFGTVFYSLQTGTDFMAAVTVCVLPFLPGDCVKMGLALFLAPILSRTLERAGLKEKWEREL